MTRSRLLTPPLAASLVLALATAVQAGPPTITAPKSGLTLPTPEVTTCDKPAQTLCQVQVVGQVAPETDAVLLASSVAEPSKLWVQRSIETNKAGEFGTIAILGTPGPTQATYELTLLSCPRGKAFKYGFPIPAIPPDCTAGTPVKVIRTQ